MRIDVRGGKKLEDLNRRLGTGAVPGTYDREVGAMGRVAGRPRRVMVWNFVGSDGQVAFRIGAADYEAFFEEGVIRSA